jgi:hypothetical protein
MESTVNNPLLATAYCLEHSLESIKEARKLHEQLVEAHTLSALEKRKLGAKIAALLTAIEDGRNVPVHLHHCLNRLRVDADHRAGISDAEGIRSPSEVWDHYERLEAAAS